MIIKTVIIDDQPENVVMLEEAISAIHDVEVIGTFNSGEEFFKVFKKLKFDLCIIDYHLPGMNGMECARRLSDKKIIMASPDTIPADEAMELDEVIDVIKISVPLNKERLTKAVKKVRDELLAERGFVVLKIFPNNRRQFRLEDILFIKGVKDIKHVVTKDEEVRTQEYNFNELLDKLPDALFCRISKSHIINIDYFHSFIDNDSIKLCYDNQKRSIELTVSDTYYNEFANKLGIED
jgi:DNA-binding LytR/AlgR family response regulator